MFYEQQEYETADWPPQSRHEQQEPYENRETDHTTRGNWIAFGSGILIAFFTANSLFSALGNTPATYVPPYYHDISLPTWTAWLPYQIPSPYLLLLPIALGILPSFIGGLHKRRLTSFAFKRGSFAWSGICLYWFPLAMYEDDAWTQGAKLDCQILHDHGYCGVHLGATGLFYLLIISYIFLLLAMLITTGLIKFYRKYLPIGS